MTPPPVFKHAVNLYAAFKNASIQATDQDAEQLEVAEGDSLFIGHWSTQFASNPDLPRESTQQKAFKFLQQIGAIEVLRKGGRDYAGIILLNREPNDEDADLANADTRALRAGKLGVVEVAVRALTNRVSDLEVQLDLVSKQYDALVRDIELSVNRVSARIDALVVEE